MKNLLRISLVVWWFLSALSLANATDQDADVPPDCSPHPSCIYNLIINGSFENPAIGGSFAVLQSIPGWVTEWGPGIEIQNGGPTGPPFHGSQYVELDSYENSAMRQDICDIAGRKYYLSFAYSPRPGMSSISNVILVFWNDTLLDCLTGVANAHTWTIHRYLVTATGNDTLRFSADGASDSGGGYIDAVRLIPCAY